ncbi:MAG: hypothetical protein RCG15_09025 [Candidatus Rickettsia vulgarisii]
MQKAPDDQLLKCLDGPNGVNNNVEPEKLIQNLFNVSSDLYNSFLRQEKSSVTTTGNTTETYNFDLD